MIERTVEEMYRDDETNQFLEVTYQNGDKEIMYFKDFSSGAMIENIVRRAKKLAIKRHIAGGAEGHPHRRTSSTSIHQEYKEHEDLPNTTNPDDWAKISGKKGERIVYVRTLVQRATTPTVRTAAARSSGSPPASTSESLVALARARGRVGSWRSARSRASRPSTASCSAAPASPTRSRRRRC